MMVWPIHLFRCFTAIECGSLNAAREAIAPRWGLRYSTELDIAGSSKVARLTPIDYYILPTANLRTRSELLAEHCQKLTVVPPCI